MLLSPCRGLISGREGCLGSYFDDGNCVARMAPDCKFLDYSSQ